MILVRIYGAIMCDILTIKMASNINTKIKSGNSVLVQYLLKIKHLILKKNKLQVYILRISQTAEQFVGRFRLVTQSYFRQRGW